MVSYLNTQGLDIVPTQCPRITRWARLQLPNRQIARSSWKENNMTCMPRMARNVKLSLNERTHFGEVQFYFQIHIVTTLGRTLALVSLYSPLNYQLLEESYHTLYSCTYQGNEALKLVDVSSIQSVIAMVPHKLPGDLELCFFLVEKPGLDVAQIAGHVDEDNEDRDGDGDGDEDKL
ncbi:hypothetical protein EV424DRAFT_1309649 [Suillus variegatus]|nr:hypothetical protein EV424DRAFT_1309649 [Suillus variegatus]